MVDIRRCTVAELQGAPNLDELLTEYGRESRVVELGDIATGDVREKQAATYRALEASGMFHPIGAFDGDRLVGFILPIVMVLPHYGVVAATVESFFVPKSARKLGIGLRLLAAAEVLAKDLGAKALLLSAPVTGPLSRVMAAKGFRHSNDVFVKAMA